MSEQNIKAAEVNSTEKETEGLKIADLLFLCLNKWYWIVISVLVCLIAAYLYIRKTPPVYQRTAAVLIKEDTPRRVSSEFAELSGMGLQSKVYNEILTLQSPAIMSGVVKELGLDVVYQSDGFFYDKTLYGTNLPYCLSFTDMDNDSFKGILTVSKNTFTLTLTEFNKDEVSTVITGKLLTPVKISEKGTMIVSRNISYQPDEEQKEDSLVEDTPIMVTKMKSSVAIEYCLAKMSAELADKNADVINLSYNDVSIERASDVVNTIIKVYNENWLKEKNQITISTSKFIDERLQVIEKELGSVDNSISTYKSNNRIPDVETAAGAYFDKSNDATDKLFDCNNQRSMANFVRQQLSSNITKNQLLPANSGIENKSIEDMIGTYNTDLLQRNNIAANSNEQNPLVVELDERLAQERSMILASLDNYIVNLDAQIRTLERKEALSNSQLSTNPTQAKYILSVERQQKVKESLYLFLLQKREENEVSQTFTAYNTRIINWATGSDKPVAPSKGKIMIIAFVLGMALPIGLLYILEIANTTVRGRKDIEGLSVPYIGEIPYAIKKVKKDHFKSFKRLLTKLGLKKVVEEEEKRTIVVKERKRDYVNEAFRVVRTNLEFMLSREGGKVVMTSSFNAGSGKTFLGMNIAVSYAIKGKKVVIVDLDLRKASLSTYVDSPKKGVAAYLNGDVKDYHDVMVKGTINKYLDVLPCGELPPNPSELLYSSNLEKMLNEMRQEYDYVFLDCPPLEMLADATIINQFVDLTAFVIRVELFERNLLPKLEQFYTEKKYKNIAIILNGAMPATGRYGYGKYGYYSRYGYGYGYGYGKSGYGYGNGYGTGYGSYISDEEDDDDEKK